MRKKCAENFLWIFIISCFFSEVNIAHGNYHAEADDLVNELDRPSEYFIPFNY